MLSLRNQLCFNNVTMSIANLTPSQLRQAADLQEQIAKLNTQLAAIFGDEVKAPAIKATKPAKKGGMSAAGKAKIAAAQKLRWAKVNAAKAKPGWKGNLIVNVFTERMIQPPNKGATPQKRRIPLGSLPAIPFEIIKR